MKSSRRKVWLLFAATFAALWFFLPRLITFLVVQTAQENGIEQLTVQQLKLGLNEVTTGPVSGHIDSPYGQVKFVLDRTAIHYSLTTLSVESVDIGSAELHWRLAEPEGSSAGAQQDPIEVPFDNLAIERLTLSLQQGEEQSRFFGALSFSKQEGGVQKLTMNGPDEEIHVAFTPQSESADVTWSRKDPAITLATASLLTAGSGSPVITAKADLVALLEWHATTQWVTPPLPEMIEEIPLESAEITFEASQVSDEWRAEGSLRIARTEIANWSFAPTGRSGSSQLTAILDLPASSLPDVLQPLMASVLDPLRITAGHASGELSVTWEDPEAPSASGNLQVNHLNGTYEGIDFHNLNLSITANNLIELQASMISTCERITLATATDLSEAELNLDFTSAGAYLRKAELSTFGGIISVEATDIEFQRDRVELQLQLSNIDFARFLAALDQEGLEGSGTLHGSLPLSFTSDGVDLDLAKLAAPQPGQLRYRPSGTADSQLDNIALQALTDFHYDALQLELSYHNNGTYQVKLHLEGNNPQLYDGYPLSLTINLSGELPELLRTTLMGADFSKEVLKKIENRQ